MLLRDAATAVFVDDDVQLFQLLDLIDGRVER